MAGLLVSVIINNYNYGCFLREAINSALNQTYRNIEIIVVDDGSTDNSRDIITSYGNCIIPLFKDNGGQGSALNAGFSASKGEIICFLDSADVWSPGKVEKVVEVFKWNPFANWLRHKLEIVNEDGERLGLFVPSYRGTRLIPPDPYIYLERVVSAYTSALVLRRSLAEKLFPIPESTFVYSADAYLSTLSCDFNTNNDIEKASGISLDEVLGFYRRHRLQQFKTSEDLVKMLQNVNDVTCATSRLWSEKAGEKRLASSIYKHQLILESLAGKSLWHCARLNHFKRGIIAAMSLSAHNPRLAARQGLAIMFSFFTPRLWTAKFNKKQGFLKIN